MIDASPDFSHSPEPDLVAAPDDFAGDEAAFFSAWADGDGLAAAGLAEAAAGAAPGGESVAWEAHTETFVRVVEAQCGLVQAYTGVDLSASHLVYEATARGWLAGGGLSPGCAERVLEAHGVDAHVRHHAGPADLLAELAAGRRVIVGEEAPGAAAPESFVHRAAGRGGVSESMVTTGGHDRRNSRSRKKHCGSAAAGSVRDQHVPGRGCDRAGTRLSSAPRGHPGPVARQRRSHGDGNVPDD